MSKLKDEIRKRQDFDSVEQEAVLNTLRTADLLARDADALLKPYRLSATAYNVLRILRGAGEPLPRGEIACRMISREPDMTRLLDRLERRGWITRTRDTRDRRVVFTQITSTALELLARLDEPVRELHRQQLAHLGEQRIRELIHLLETVRSGRRQTGEQS
jgi:DNA-binding MarR family transcriptional regulator